MDKPISVGDLVIALRQHCEVDGVVGSVFTVQEIAREPYLWLECSCGAKFAYGESHSRATQDGWHPTAWLKRIPPLDELESEKREEEIPA